MSFEDTVALLYSQLPVFQRDGVVALKHKLDNIRTICSILGNPHEKFKSIHVAGTNGKGSTSHMIASVLHEVGYKVGLYTSPHLKSFTERIRVNGQEVDKTFVVDFVEQVKPLFDTIQPSFFEITVAMAFEYFAQQKVDYAVIEVGLGGRLDSTNIISPIVSVITNISYDHQYILGNTLAEIASEKAGIIKSNTPVVIGEYQQDIHDVFVNKALEYDATLFLAHQKEIPLALNQIDRPSYLIKNTKTVLVALEVIQAVENIAIAEGKIIKGILEMQSKTGLKGRWQCLSTQPRVYVDTAHNEDGIRNVLNHVNSISYKKLWVIIGMANDKSHDAFLVQLPKDANYIYCEANIQRAMKAEALHTLAQTYGLKGVIINDVNQAIESAKENADQEDLIIVVGSNFVIAEIIGL